MVGIIDFVYIRWFRVRSNTLLCSNGIHEIYILSEKKY